VTLFATKFEPDYEVTRRVVQLLRGDSEINSLLFSEKAAVHVSDVRVYSAYVELPESPPLRSTLPRMLVEARGVVRLLLEQENNPQQPLGDVDVWLHCLVPATNEQLAEQLDARARDVIASTPLSTPRILGSGLVPNGSRLKVREPAFSAWRLTRQYRAHLVGVL
jgi:hypothetical protein